MTENNIGGVFQFRERRVYRGTVTNQRMEQRNGVTTLTVYVNVEGELTNSFNPKSTVLPVPPGEQEVNLRFDPARPDTMQYSIDDLTRMGFEGDDLAVLNPNHAAPFLLKGRQVFITPKVKIQGDRETTYWNFRTPKPVEEQSCAVEDLKGSPAAEEFRRLMMQKSRPGSKDATPSMADNTTTTGTKGGKAPKAKDEKAAVPSSKIPF